MDPVDVPALRDLAIAVAQEAGALLLDGQRRARVDVGTKTSTTDMVSEMDRASEALVVGRILDARPHDGIVGEEGASREGTTGVTWVIDPLDGTTNYLYGHPSWAVSIAAEVEGPVVAGCVHDPTHAETYAAALGHGATCNGDAIAPSALDDLSTALVGTGFSYRARERAAQAEIVRAVLPEVRDIRRIGAAALDLCWVARGRLDAYFEEGLAPWDLAAGGLIATEAGAVVTGFSGGPVTPAHVAAAGPRLAPALRALLARAGATGRG